MLGGGVFIYTSADSVLEDPVPPLRRLHHSVVVVCGCNLSRQQVACGTEHASLDVSENTATDAALFWPVLPLSCLWALSGCGGGGGGGDQVSIWVRQKRRWGKLRPVADCRVDIRYDGD